MSPTACSRSSHTYTHTHTATHACTQPHSQTDTHAHTRPHQAPPARPPTCSTDGWPPKMVTTSAPLPVRSVHRSAWQPSGRFAGTFWHGAVSSSCSSKGRHAGGKRVAQGGQVSSTRRVNGADAPAHTHTHLHTFTHIHTQRSDQRSLKGAALGVVGSTYQNRCSELWGGF